MQKSFLIFCLLQFSLLVSAQSIHSNEISWFSGIYEKIDFFDEDGNKIFSVAGRFYKPPKNKKRIKPIKVQDQTYFIERKNIFGDQSVYSSSGKHVANIDRTGFEIQFVGGGTYTLDPKVRLTNFNELKCFNSDGELVSSLAWKRDRRLSFDNANSQTDNLLLLSLCASQYQELLLGERGRLTSSF